MKKTKLSILVVAFIVIGAGVSSAYAFGPKSDLFTDEQKAVFGKINDLRGERNFRGTQGYYGGMGYGRGMGGGYGMGSGYMGAMRVAVDNNDYETFKNLTTNDSFMSGITEDDFAQMVEMHGVMGMDYTQRNKLSREEVGLRMGRGMMGGGFGRGMGYRN